ncbi:unnamed protein product, partial [marine sediment metagenome]
FNDYGKKVLQELLDNEIRAEINLNNETLSKKILEAETQKIPYILVVGEKEEKDNSVSVRSRSGDEGSSKLEEFVKRIKKDESSHQ